MRIQVAGAILLSTTQAFAQGEQSEFAACLDISNSSARLSCYDAAAGYVAPPSEDVVAPSWTLVEATDPMTGANVSRAFIEPNATSSRDAPAVLVIQCEREGPSSIYVWTEGFIGSQNRIRVQYRWADDDPISENWDPGTSGRSAFLPQNFRDFRRGLEAGGELVFEWLDFNGARSISTWDQVVLDDNALFALNGCESS